MNNKDGLTVGRWDSEKKEWAGENQEAEAELTCNSHSWFKCDCADCDFETLARCKLREQLDAGKVSIYDKMTKYGWHPKTVELEKMTLDQLNEVNKAFDDMKRRDAILEVNKKSQLTVGSWDPIKKEWTNKSLSNPTGAGADSEFFLDTGLTAGKWDQKKKMWTTR